MVVLPLGQMRERRRWPHFRWSAAQHDHLGSAVAAAGGVLDSDRFGALKTLDERKARMKKTRRTLVEGGNVFDEIF